MSEGGDAGQEGYGEKEEEPVLLGLPRSTLLDRLGSGIGSVAEADRAAYETGNDAQAWKNRDLRQELRRVDDAQVSSVWLRHLPGSRRALAKLFAASGSEHLVRALLHHPEHLLGVALPKWLRPGSHEDEEEQETRATEADTRARPEDSQAEGEAPQEEQASPLQVWAVFTVCVEALWEHVSGPKGQAHRHLEPLAARTRFLALSEPFRHQDAPEWKEWWQGESLQHLFGHSNTWVPLVRRVREARDVWRGYLDRYQALPLFDHAPPFAIEKEIRWLAFQDSKSERFLFGGGPLALSGPVVSPPEEKRWVAPPTSTAADRAVLGEVVERHLLPRFAVVAAWSAVCGLYRRAGHRCALVMYWVLLTAGVAAASFLGAALVFEWASFTWALIGIGLFYLVIGVGVLAFGRLWAMPLLLRLPAAGAVGMILLVAFHPDWWQNVGLAKGLLAVLGGAALGYLVIEARNHNTGSVTGGLGAPLVLLGRALAVATTGFVHSLFVAAMGMVTITTVFGESGTLLRQVWEGDSGAGDPLAILSAATFWCLAAGVFSQILWDDQPITAPLSHRRWRER